MTSSKSPYITANALIRYCLAKAPERHRIIQEFRDNEFPPFKGWYGGETEGAIRRYIASGGSDDLALADLEAVLEKRPIDTEHDEAKVLKQLEALQGAREIDLTKIAALGQLGLITDTLPPFFIQSVRVSIRPTNLIVAERVGYKTPFIGVLRPYLSSSDPLDVETAKLHGALLHWYAEVQLQHLGTADPRLTFVVDVFARRVFRAPSAFKQRRELLAYSCQEILDRWSSEPTKVAVAKA